MDIAMYRVAEDLLTAEFLGRNGPIKVKHGITSLAILLAIYFCF